MVFHRIPREFAKPELFQPYHGGILRINWSKNLSQLRDFFTATLLYYQDSENNSKPDPGLPDAEQYGVVPKHYLVLRRTSISDTQLTDFKLRLVDLSTRWKDFIEEIYLLGESWQELDEDGIVKSENSIYYTRIGDFNYKTFHQNIFPLESLYQDDKIRPKSFVWFY